MKNACFRFLCIAFIIVGLQSLVLTQEKLKIAVVPKGKEAIFWKSVHAGANIGAFTSKNVEIIWKSPQTEDDRAQQISIVEQCIEEGVSGIVLSPVDNNALVESVSRAMKKKIPVLIFDSALKGKPGKDFISFVGIDNRKAGNLAGENLAKLLKGKGKVVLLRYVAGQANTTEREEGFLEAIAKEKGIQLIVQDRYTGGTIDGAKKAGMSLISQLKKADGIFCPNEISTMGMLLALRDINLAGKIKFIGFDVTIPLIKSLKNGELNAVIAQDPSRIGYQSIKAIIDYIHGKKIPSTIDIGVYLVTRENLNDPEIQKLYSMSNGVE
ncbi:MAG: substrate-binding domain-containing protein [Bacteroidota bacterium]|jgi:ribose transport system substrate-binding protein